MLWALVQCVRPRWFSCSQCIGFCVVKCRCCAPCCLAVASIYLGGSPVAELAGVYFDLAELGYTLELLFPWGVAPPSQIPAISRPGGDPIWYSGRSDISENSSNFNFADSLHACLRCYFTGSQIQLNKMDVSERSCCSCIHRNLRDEVRVTRSSVQGRRYPCARIGIYVYFVPRVPGNAVIR